MMESQLIKKIFWNGKWFKETELSYDKKKSSRKGTKVALFSLLHSQISFFGENNNSRPNKVGLTS